MLRFDWSLWRENRWSLSRESTAHFDAEKGGHFRRNFHVIQGNEYYPFGMQTVNCWTRENNTANNFLANGGTEYNATSSLYDLDYRTFDPVLGRMNGVDPIEAKYAGLSPYNYSFNDPVNFADPGGADPSDPNYAYNPGGTDYGDPNWLTRYVWSGYIYGAYTGYDVALNPRYGTFVQNDVNRVYGARLDWRTEAFAGVSPVGGSSVSSSLATILGNWNNLPDGAYMMSFSNGYLSNLDYLSNSDIRGMGSSYNKEFVGGVAGPITSDYSGGARLWGNSEGTSFYYPGAVVSWQQQMRPQGKNGGNPQALYAGIGAISRRNDLNTLSAMLFGAETSLFTMDAQAQYQLASNAMKRSSTFFKSGLNASDDLLRTIRIGATALGKVTFVAGAAVSIAGVIQDPTAKNIGWAAADITVGAVGLFSGSIATGLATAGLAIPGLNVIIAGAALGYAGYRLYQAYNDGN